MRPPRKFLAREGKRGTGEPAPARNGERRLYQLIKEAVPGAVPEEAAMAGGGNPRLKAPLGILFAEDQAVSGQQGHKGNIVVLGHRVVRCDKVF